MSSVTKVRERWMDDLESLVGNRYFGYAEYGSGRVTAVVRWYTDESGRKQREVFAVDKVVAQELPQADDESLGAKVAEMREVGLLFDFHKFVVDLRGCWRFVDQRPYSQREYLIWLGEVSPYRGRASLTKRYDLWHNSAYELREGLPTVSLDMVTAEGATLLLQHDETWLCGSFATPPTSDREPLVKAYDLGALHRKFRDQRPEFYH